MIIKGSFSVVLHKNIWAPSSEFVSSSIPSWQILTAHDQPFRGAKDLVFCLKVPLDSVLVWASSGGSGETARMRRLAWTFAARIGYKYQIRLTRSICCGYSLESPSARRSNEYPQHMSLWRNNENYPQIILKYPHLFLWMLHAQCHSNDTRWTEQWNVMNMIWLTCLYLAFHKRDTDKQYRPISDAAERDVWLGPPLFANMNFYQK